MTIGIGMEADAGRRSLHPEGVVTYIIDRNTCSIAMPPRSVRCRQLQIFNSSKALLTK